MSGKRHFRRSEGQVRYDGTPSIDDEAPHHRGISHLLSLTDFVNSENSCLFIIR